MNYKIIYNILIPAIVFAGCAKETTTRVNVTPDSNTQTAIATDEVTINDEFDQAVDDALAVICNPKTTITGADIDTSQNNLGVITIYYNKINEADGTKQRQGSDSIHQNLAGGKIVPWGTPGTTATITLGCMNSPGYEVFYNNNNTTVILTGTTVTLTNVYGGYLQNITGTDSLVTHLRSNLVFTYNDNIVPIQYYYWTVNRLRSFTMSGTTLYASTRGDTVISGSSNVADWGTTRTGSSFYTVISSSVIQNISDAALSYNPIKGTKNIDGITQPIFLTLGVNSQDSVQATGTPYGFSLSWVNGSQNIAVEPYYY
jgi:hypothetical protein